MDRELKDLGIKGQTRGAADENNISNSDEVHGAKDSPASLYMGYKISEVPDLVKENNPTTYITENVPPFFIEHGTIDNVVPITQSRNFVQELKKKSKNKVEFIEVEGAKHGGEKFDKTENLDKIFNFLKNIESN